MTAPKQNELDRFQGKTAGQQMLHGSVWMVAMRWAMRGIGLVSTLILARLLSPEDFGVVAMTMAGMQILNVLFTESGLRIALIRHPDPQRVHYDTAWTLSILLGALVGLMIFAAAPLVADYFEEPLIADLMRILALSPLIQGFENIGTVNLQKHLRFSADFRFNVATKIAAFVATLGLAVWLQNYWALVLGTLASMVARTLISYLASSYRPRLCLKATSELFGFSVWVLFSGLGEHATNLADRLIAGRLFGPESVGFYHVASELAVAPARELTVSITRALQPVYALLAADPRDLGVKYVSAIGVVATISLPASIGLALVASDLVPIVLGEKWRASGPLIAWLAPAFALHFLTRTSYTLLHVLGRARTATLLRWPVVLLIAVAMYVGGVWYGITGVAAGRFFALLLAMPWPFLVTGHLVHLRVRDFAGALWRPTAAVATMAVVVLLLHQEQLPHLLRLAVDVGVGAVTYAAALLLFWYCAGRPEGGVEAHLAARLRAWRRPASA